VKISVFILTGLLIFGCFFGCNGKEQSVFTPDDYDSWESPTDEVLNYPIPGHESNYRIIYFNKTGQSPNIKTENSKKSYDYPAGTIIVKEIYEGLDDPQGKPPGRLFIMVKDPEHPSARGGWLWIVKDVAQNKERIFSEELCITCHTNANEAHPYGDNNTEEEFRDFVFFPFTAEVR
jgi:hypothetical protein